VSNGVEYVFCNMSNTIGLGSYNGEGCWWWHLMEQIRNNLMKLGVSLGNDPVKSKKKLAIKSRYILDSDSGHGTSNEG
jgi:hypothetical protein